MIDRLTIQSVNIMDVNSFTITVTITNHTSLRCKIKNCIQLKELSN